MRKCDVWAFGLLSWEILLHGPHYYHHPDVERELKEHMIGNELSSSNEGSDSGLKELDMSVKFQSALYAISPRLRTIARSSISWEEIPENYSLKHGTSLRGESGHMKKFPFETAKGLLYKSLQPEPKIRPRHIEELPFVYGSCPAQCEKYSLPFCGHDSSGDG